MHTYIRLCGFGWDIVPYAPYVIRRLDDGSDDCISIAAAGHHALLDPRGKNVAETLQRVADVEPGEPLAHWAIKFGQFGIAWPNHFALMSTELAGVPFDLVGGGGVVFAQRPTNPVTDDDLLVALGQRLVARDSQGGVRWVELHYELEDGAAWLQRHYLLPQDWVITMQAPRTSGGLVIDVAGELAQLMIAQLQAR
jgi:hypothetical protein